MSSTQIAALFSWLSAFNFSLQTCISGQCCQDVFCGTPAQEMFFGQKKNRLNWQLKLGNDVNIYSILKAL
jgi:hypothetical protein